MSLSQLFMARDEREDSFLSWPVRALNYLAVVFLISALFYFSFHQLNYHWGWASVYRYKLMFLKGWWMTVKISVASHALSAIIGL